MPCQRAHISTTAAPRLASCPRRWGRWWRPGTRWRHWRRSSWSRWRFPAGADRGGGVEMRAVALGVAAQRRVDQPVKIAQAVVTLLTQAVARAQPQLFQAPTHDTQIAWMRQAATSVAWR